MSVATVQDRAGDDGKTPVLKQEDTAGGHSASTPDAPPVAQ